MTDTPFGPGMFAATFAERPAAPIVSVDASDSLAIIIAPDANPPHTEYALHNDTEGAWIDADGALSALPCWRTRAEWNGIRAVGLDPATTYAFSVHARNSLGMETGPGPAAALSTWNAGADRCALGLIIRKVSSTIAAPAFMEGEHAGIRFAGKDLHDLGFHADRVTGLDLPRVTVEEELPPGALDRRVWETPFAPKRLMLEGHVHGISTADLALRLGYLKSCLASFSGGPGFALAPVRIERDDLPGRFWEAWHESFDTVEPIGRWGSATSARVRITLRCPSPFAAATEITRRAALPDEGAFTPLDLGDAPSDAVYVITGPSERPGFAVGDMLFFCNFDDGLAYTDAANDLRTGLFNPPEDEPAARCTTDTGVGLLVSGDSTVTFDCPGNPADGAWVIVITPQWGSDEVPDSVTVFEHAADADNGLRLTWDPERTAWVCIRTAGGVSDEVASPPQAFTAGTPVVLGMTYDSTNAGGLRLFVDGIAAGVSSRVAPFTIAPDTLTLHAVDGTGQPDAVVDRVVGWSRMLSADEMLRIAVNPEAVTNSNQVVRWEGSLAAGDRLTLNSRRQGVEVTTIADGVRHVAIDCLAGNIPLLLPGRRRTVSDRTQTVIHTLADCGAFEVRYRRRYL